MRLIVCVALLSTSPVALSAQTLSSLTAGTVIRVVTTQGTTVEGRLQSLTSDSVTLRPENAFLHARSVARPIVFSVERRAVDGSDRITSGLLGGVLGGAIGYLLSGNSSSSSTSANKGTIIGAAAAGGFVGGLLFPMIHHWIPVPKD